MRVRTRDFDANTPGVAYHTERSKTAAQETTEVWSVQACAKKFESLEPGVLVRVRSLLYQLLQVSGLLTNQGLVLAPVTFQAGCV